ncbi:MAG: hypothetical protein VZR27_10870 [Acutalibacteraceae bacterium]|nr:hypothetical protein [Clostridia bacterium]MEE3451171.1 hypothetical protein [Acutalibacteraceae bacterium]
MKNTVTCPYCGTMKSVSQNMQYKCSGCGARITIGNNAEIKSASPKK